MKITESRQSFARRAQEDYQTEVEKILSMASGTSDVALSKLASAVVRTLRVAHSRLRNVEEWLAENEKEQARQKNRFAEADSVQEVIGQAIGAGSTCWVGGTGAAEFDSDQAVQISAEATERIKTLLTQGKF
jgi:hypothetical protein